MPIELKMPALSPTMEEGTLAKWLVKEGDSVSSGDLLAEIETDKATMEFEAVDEGVITQILVAEGTDGVKVGTVIAMIHGEDDERSACAESSACRCASAKGRSSAATAARCSGTCACSQNPPTTASRPARSPSASPQNMGVDLATVTGTGPDGRIVKADVEAAASGAPPSAAPPPPHRAGSNARVRPRHIRQRHPARSRQALATCAKPSRAA